MSFYSIKWKLKSNYIIGGDCFIQWKFSVQIIKMDEIIFEVFKAGVGLWQYFIRSIGGEYAKCTVESENGITCDSVLAMGKKKSTGSLHRHLTRIHKIDLKRRNDASDDGNVPWKKARDSLERVLSRLTARDGFSFRALANSFDIKRLFPLGGYTIPDSANTIREMVLIFASGIRRDITEELAVLKASGLLFSLTMDEWTSIRGRK